MIFVVFHSASQPGPITVICESIDDVRIDLINIAAHLLFHLCLVFYVSTFYVMLLSLRQ